MLLLTLLPIMACGGQSQDDQALAVLVPQVEEIRASAAAGRRVEAERAVDELRRTLDDLTRQGRLSDPRAESIRDAADEVERNLHLVEPPTPTPRPTPTRTMRTSPPPQTQTPTPEPSPEPTLVDGGQQSPPADDGAPGEPGGGPGQDGQPQGDGSG